MSRPALPIDTVLPDIVRAVGRGHVVIEAPPGAGKTTRVPPALLDRVGGEIVVLEPRRVAARAAASRMAEEAGEDVGQTYGYQVRLDRRASRQTRVLVVTEGILLRRLVADPFLEGVGAVVLDEIHERSLDGDLCLAMARRAAEVRDDLRVIAMSATLDADPIARFLDAEVVRSAGRTFPVDVRHLPRPDDRRVADVVADGVRRALEATDGDVLAFLPGAREIRWTAERLTDVDAEVVPLHGRLPPRAQDRALRPADHRRVVLSTNVAETSVTIPGVTAVVDSGLVRTLQHDGGSGLDRLVTVATSQASADQRAGRAGRTAPGVAFRLWTDTSHVSRSPHDTPEVARADLTGAVLSLLAAGEPDVRAFPWFEPPPDHALDTALDLLTLLGAVEDGRLTEAGRAMAAVPAHPRVAAMLVAADAHGARDAGVDLAALLADRSPFRRDTSAAGGDDVAELVEALDRPGAHGWRPVSDGAVARTRRLADRLGQQLRRAWGARGGRSAEGLHRAVLAGWPDRVGRWTGDRWLLANGRGAVPGRGSAVRAPWIVAVEVVDTDRTEARVHMAMPLDPDLLQAPATVEVWWDPARDRVVGARRRRWGAIVLEEQEGVPVPDDRVHAALAEAVRAHPDRAVPDDRDTRRLIARLGFAARTHPDWPAVDEAGLVQLAIDLSAGCRRLADLRRLDWIGALLGRLSWDQRQAFEREVPERITVPSGSAVRLDFPDDGPPVLAVRMQELFGWTDTPQVGGAPVLLHLLAPNGRPQQVTDDLAGFWARVWPEVRKDLRGRYPKHPWPEDPTTAPAWRPGMRRRR